MQMDSDGCGCILAGLGILILCTLLGFAAVEWADRQPDHRQSACQCEDPEHVDHAGGDHVR